MFAVGMSVITMTLPPMTSATSAATTRSQNVARLRAATRNSRSTMGRKVMAGS